MITVHPSSNDVPLGHNFTLSCQASGQGTLQYSWEVYNGNTWHAVGNMAVYTTEANTDGVVEYRCVVTNEAGSKTSNTANINIYGKFSRDSVC